MPRVDDVIKLYLGMNLSLVTDFILAQVQLKSPGHRHLSTWPSEMRDGYTC